MSGARRVLYPVSSKRVAMPLIKTACEDRGAEQTVVERKYSNLIAPSVMPFVFVIVRGRIVAGRTRVITR
jgi:hypothetical protein